MTVVAYVPDLIDRAKVAAAGDVVFVDHPEALVDAPGDLNNEPWIAVAPGALRGPA